MWGSTDSPAATLCLSLRVSTVPTPESPAFTSSPNKNSPSIPLISEPVTFLPKIPSPTTAPKRATFPGSPNPPNPHSQC